MIYLIILAVIWVYVVRKQRSKSLNRTISDYSGTLSPLAAQKVVREFAQYESPFLYAKSLEFALFKTYAIPSISRLLAKTDQLVGTSSYGKRVEDTDVILNTATTFDLNSELSTLAIARMNFLHSQYGSKIQNDDLLYTLSLFMMEPVKWHAKFGWRAMHEVEVNANFQLWKAIGERMSIKEIPETYAELCAWSEDYEEMAMVYADSNKSVANSSVDLFLRPAPIFLRGLARKIVYALLERRTLSAFGYEKQPAWVHYIVHTIFKMRNAYIHLSLPATESAQRISEVEASGRINPRFWNFEPYYVKDTWMTRLRAKWLGLNYDSKKYHAEGFKLEEVGPTSLIGKGVPEVFESARRMRGCPFA